MRHLMKTRGREGGGWLSVAFSERNQTACTRGTSAAGRGTTRVLPAGGCACAAGVLVACHGSSLSEGPKNNTYANLAFFFAGLHTLCLGQIQSTPTPFSREAAALTPGSWGALSCWSRAAVGMPQCAACGDGFLRLARFGCSGNEEDVSLAACGPSSQ